MTTRCKITGDIDVCMIIPSSARCWRVLISIGVCRSERTKNKPTPHVCCRLLQFAWGRFLQPGSLLVGSGRRTFYWARVPASIESKDCSSYAVVLYLQVGICWLMHSRVVIVLPDHPLRLQPYVTLGSRHVRRTPVSDVNITDLPMDIRRPGDLSKPRYHAWLSSSGD